MRRRARANRGAATVVECASSCPSLSSCSSAWSSAPWGCSVTRKWPRSRSQAARYASTHGHQYRKDAGLPIGTSTDWSSDVYNNAIAPNIVSLELSQLSYQVSWPDVINQPGKPDNWPGSQVTVTVSYQWFPEMYLVGPFNLTSTSSMPITN